MAKTATRKSKPKAVAKRATTVRRQPKAEPKSRTVLPRPIRARYDAAQNDPENRKHWASADALSAASANTKAVRITLRNRSRYEIANNGYARGIVNTISNHVIGTGPRLQVETGNPEADEIIEREFAKWAKAVRLGAKLRTMQVAKRQDGEAFAILKTNEFLSHSVKLDLSLIEADMVTAPVGALEITATSCDGIDFDGFGNPKTYHVLSKHPGTAGGAPTDIAIPASQVLHWFRCDRPGQFRGIPELTSSLALFAQLRRYTLATIAAAETVANFAMVAQSNMAPDDETPADPFEEIELTRNMLTVLPQGYTLGQVDPKQPITGYKEFKSEIINEAARPFDMPFNIAACNSSGYNYSSGRLDHQTYYRGVTIEQTDCEQVVCGPLLAAWVAEGLLTGAVPSGLAPMEEWTIGWFWDGQVSADAEKDAGADEKDLANGTTTLSQIIGDRGGDWRKVMRQRQAEKKYASELGLPMPAEGDAPTDATQPPKDIVDENGQPTGDPKAAAVAGDVQATALNGAQIASLVSICDKLSEKSYPDTGAEAMVQAAFPLMDRTLIGKFIKAIASHDAPKPDPVAAPPGAPPFANTPKQGSPSAKPAA